MKHLVIGKRGQGKTTILNNIAKLYDVEYTVCYNTESELPKGINIKHKFRCCKITNEIDTKGVILDNVFWNPEYDKLLRVLTKIPDKVVLVSMPYIINTTSETLNEFDYIHIFKDNIMGNLEKKYRKIFTKSYETFEDFKEANEKLRNYELLVYEKSNCLSG